jgi:hypothetical protein
LYRGKSFWMVEIGDPVSHGASEFSSNPLSVRICFDQRNRTLDGREGSIFQLREGERD